MYHSNLNIHILSKNEQLAEALCSVAPPERFSLQFKTFSAITQESLAGCDILILDLPGRDSQAMLSRVQEKVQVVLCTDAQGLAAAQCGTGRQCADYWLAPAAPAFAVARFGGLLDRIKTQKDYRLAQTCLDTAINSVPDLVWFKDLRGSHEKVNDAFCRAVGKTKQDVQGRGHYYIWDLEPEEYAKGEYVCLETEEEVLRQRRTCLFDEKVKSKNGMRQFKTYKSPIFDDEGEVIGTVGVAHDVTDLENIGTELEILIRSIPFAILIRNSEGLVINVNDKFTEYFQMPREQIMGKNYDFWKENALTDLTKTNVEGYVEAALTIGGRQKIFEIHEEPIFDVFHDLVGQLCIYRDVTVERTLEQKILYNSNTDFTTGLYNRRYFYDYIKQSRGNQQVNLIYLDLDRFKNVNDSYGHQAGDEALVLTAKLLKESFPEAFITRLGGDEFLITLLGPWGIESLERRAGQLLERMELAFRSSRQWSALTASIGIAQSSDPTVKIDALLRQSDVALYAAKQRGRARYCVYTEDMG